MAVYNDTLPTSNLKYDDIRDTLNSSGGSVTNVVSTAFKATSGINVWSKHKPVILSVNFCQDFDSGAANYNATWWQGRDGNCGLTPKVLYAFSDVVNNTDGGMNGWVYSLPNGESDQPLRLGDFAGYCKAANPPVYNLLATPSKVADGSATPISISAGIRIGTDSRQLTFADFPYLKNYYFGVYCLGEKKGYHARATSSATIGSGSAGLSINPKSLSVDTYDVYPFLASAPIKQDDADMAMTLYTLPNLQVCKFQVVYENELYYVSVTASVTGSLNDEVSWTVKFTVQDGGEARTFTHLTLEFRFPGNDFGEPLKVGEKRENYDIKVTVNPGQTVTIKTGTTTIISEELLSDCAVWAQVTGVAGTYRSNTYIHK